VGKLGERALNWICFWGSAGILAPGDGWNLGARDPNCLIGRQIHTCLVDYNVNWYHLVGPFAGFPALFARRGCVFGFGGVVVVFCLGF